VLYYTGTAPLFKNVITRKVNKYLIWNPVRQYSVAHGLYHDAKGSWNQTCSNKHKYESKFQLHHGFPQMIPLKKNRNLSKVRNLRADVKKS